MVNLAQLSSMPVFSNACLETQLLLQCARSRIDVQTADRIKKLSSAAIDWSLLVRLGHHQKVIPLLYQSLKSVCSETVPAIVLSQLQNRVRANTLWNLFLAKELVAVLGMLEENGIKAIPFKGPTLAMTAYGDLGLRRFGDLDILVQKQDFIKAKKLIISQKYQLAVTDLQELLIFKHAFQSPFRHHSSRFTIDLHWGLSPKRPGRRHRFDCLWSNLGSISLLGQSVPTLSPESTLVVQCINAVKEPADQSLKQICDIAEVIKTYPNLSWKTAFSIAQQLGCERLFLIGLNLSHQLYGTVLPEEASQKISSIPIVQKYTRAFEERFFQLDANKVEESPVERGLWGKGLDVDQSINQYAFETTDLTDRPLYTLDKLVSPNFNDATAIPLSPSLYGLYYFIRPVRLCASLVEKRILMLKSG